MFARRISSSFFLSVYNITKPEGLCGAVGQLMIGMCLVKKTVNYTPDAYMNKGFLGDKLVKSLADVPELFKKRRKKREVD